MRSSFEEKFSDFYEKWMNQLEDHLRLLQLVLKEPVQESACQSMYNKLTAHHKEYFQSKWDAANEDVLAFFCPVWLSSLEKACLWVTGWKPSTAFRLVDSLIKKTGGTSLSGMSEEQLKKIEVLRLNIKVEENRVEREMERQQVALADRRMVELARLESAAKKNGDSAAITQVNEMVEAAMKGLLHGLEKVMKMADCARLKTLKGVLDVLTPMQRVDFLVATSRLQIQMRKWGKNRDNKFSGNVVQSSSVTNEAGATV